MEERIEWQRGEERVVRRGVEERRGEGDSDKRLRILEGGGEEEVAGRGRRGQDQRLPDGERFGSNHQSIYFNIHLALPLRT